MSHDCLTDLYIRMIVSPKTFPQKILCDLPLGNSSRILMDSAEKPAMVRCQGGLSLQRRGLGDSRWDFVAGRPRPPPQVIKRRPCRDRPWSCKSESVMLKLEVSLYIYIYDFMYNIYIYMLVYVLVSSFYILSSSSSKSGLVTQPYMRNLTQLCTRKRSLWTRNGPRCTRGRDLSRTRKMFLSHTHVGWRHVM